MIKPQSVIRPYKSEYYNVLQTLRCIVRQKYNDRFWLKIFSIYSMFQIKIFIFAQRNDRMAEAGVNLMARCASVNFEKRNAIRYFT